MIKEIVFGLFGTFYQLEDSYKENDPQGKKRGILQRYHEMLGDEVDTNLVSKLRDVFKNIVNPDTMLPEFLPLAEQAKGLLGNIFDSTELRRKMLRHINNLNKNKGTLANYTFLFGLLGFDVDVIESYPDGTFDSGTFDRRLLDGFYSNRASYTITLTCRYPFSITADIEAQVARIIQYNHPIHAKVDGVNYVTPSTGLVDFNTADFNSLDFN